MLSGIKTRIETNRFEETVHFYSDILGLRIVRQWHDDADTGAILALSDADASAYLEIASVPVTQASAGVCLQFRTDDLNIPISKLARKVDHSAPEKKPWGSTYITMSDPAGNRVIVFEGEL